MKKVEMYCAEDGKVFDNEKDCELYEQSDKLYNAMNTIREYCDSQSSCEWCIFNNADDGVDCVFDVPSPCEWNKE